MSETQSCGSCRFSNEGEPNWEGPMLQCLRNPPMMLIIDEMASIGWPPVRPFSWCGEYRPVNADRTPATTQGGEAP